jgi:VWFA-related protein
LLRLQLGLVIVAFVVSTARAQTPTPTPTPPPPTFSAEANLVHVDVLATDKRGRQIPDLKPEDFEIETNGRKYRPAIATYIPLAPDAAPQSSPVGSGRKPRSEDVRRVITFVISRPGRGGGDFMRATRRLESMFRHFIENDVRPGDLVSIVNMESRRPLFNQLTSDPAVMSAAVDAFHADSNDGSYHALPPDGTPDVQARYAVDAAKLAQEAVERMEGLPGRKLLIVIADHLRMTDPTRAPEGMQTRGPNPFTVPYGYRDARKELEELTRKANRDGVTIYSVKTLEQDEARNKQNAPRLEGAPPPLQDQVQPSLPDPGAEALRFLSDSTGGATLVNLDLLESDLSRVMDRNRGYYLLGFDPGEKPSTASRGVRVRVMRDNVQVTARPKVFPDVAKSLNNPAGMSRMTLENAIDSAVSAGAIEVRIEPRVQWIGNNSGEFRATVEIDRGSLSKDVEERGLEVLWRFRDEHANVLQSSRRTLSAQSWPKEVQVISFTLSQTVGKAGACQLDVAVREVSGSKMGSASVLVTWPPSR